MEVRFSGQALHCQIGRSELERLNSGRSVDLLVQLPRNHTFRVSLRPSPMSADRGGWQLDSDPTGLWLTIPRSELEMMGQTTTFAERLMREFPVSDGKVQVIVEAVPDADQGERSVIEIIPHATDATDADASQSEPPPADGAQ